MKLILLLSGENLKLAREEASSIAETNKHQQDGKIIVLDTENDMRRLAFTKKILKYLFSCKLKDLENNIKKFEWCKVYKKNFCVRIKGETKLKEKELAGMIWHQLKKPKVDLERPATNIHFFITKNKAYCGLLLHENKEEFQERRPHLRKEFHPTSIHPKLARALVNLSRIKKGQTLLDPFCGTGGILIEAGLIGCKLKGNDISQEMIKKTKINLKSFNLKAELTINDALEIKTKTDAIVTDLPYGRLSYHNIDLEELYKKFLKKAYNLLKPNKYLVAVFPKKINIKTRLKIIKKIDFYVHSSLTRHIIVAKK